MGSWRAPAAPVDLLMELSHRLTDRDRAIVADLGRFRLFTLDQFQRVYFDSYSATRDRIASLFELGVLQRFRPHTRASFRYLLGWHGLRMIHAARAEEYERDPYVPYSNARKPKPGRAPSKAAAQEYADRIIASAHRGHLEGINDFYSRLAAACRGDETPELARWYTEAETDEEAPLHGMRADGAFDLATARGEAVFYFEFDTGTETLTRLAAKAVAYGGKVAGEQRSRRAYGNEGRRASRPRTEPLRFMLIELTRPGREDNLHDRLAESGLRLPVATTTARRAADPLGPVWRLAGDPAGARRRLDQLPIFH